jgi:uncharacterized protein (DUF697 family)
LVVDSLPFAYPIGAMAFSWWKWRNTQPTSDEAYAKQIEQLRETVPVPGIWLFGKTGSGKSSVVRYLTGAEEATIGEGYRPKTKASRRFDFPNSLEPLLTFLDTRGLAEVAYDPSEDIEQFSGSTQLMIVTVRVTDHALESILEPLRRIRKSAPDRQVLLVLTCLHEAVGNIDLSDGVDPFTTLDDDQTELPKPIPEQLQTLIAEKVRQFAGVHDAVIPIDLTRLEDGFVDPDFGGCRLKQAILDRLPHAYRQALLAIDELRIVGESTRQQKSRWQVLASSALAGTAGAVPVPWVDIPAVLAIQAHLAVKIAKIYDQELTAARWAILSSAVGFRIPLRFAARGALKFIPWLGMAVGAASAFAFTYALGMSWDWYFADLRKGNVPSPDQLKDVFAAELKRGHELWNAK